MKAGITSEKIIILDFGSQYTQLIARRIREAGVYSEILPHETSLKRIIEMNASGVIMSGGPESVNTKKALKFDPKLLDSNIPVLGICYGMQTMAKHFGGIVSSSDKREFGNAVLKVNKGLIFSGLSTKTKDLNVWMSHGDKVTNLPKGFKKIGSSNNSAIAAFENIKLKKYGFQFHPEVTHTNQGQKILKTFVKDICGCSGKWRPKNIVDSLIQDIKSQVGDKKVLLGISGGVDSSVVAALLSKAIGKNLECIFVDNGLLRKGEAEQVKKDLKRGLKLNINFSDSEKLFLKNLKGESDPEKKRKIIGKTFIDVFLKETKKLKNISFLAQGTIYPDVIESSGIKNGKAHIIKSHHNVGGLPSYLKLPLVEPLTSLFKDEVRKIGKELGLPDYLINRHPFPGPGLAVRTLGEIKKERLEILRAADFIFMEELNSHNLYDKVSQAFAVFLPIKSVGVVGDARRYEYVIALRAAETTDFMTANAAKLDHEFLNLLSDRIINEIPQVSRVVYDISSKPPATIEWE
ncbi:glutamine-hydrolyzing GMP synthase [SAR86 cluster bacterium]|nr:glutamine-hydrolyzing GMP synthase [SAR86 cluster bacterium]